MSVECPKCNTENTSDSQFCKSCATLLPFLKEIPVTETFETPTEELIRGAIFASRYEIIEELEKGETPALCGRFAFQSACAAGSVAVPGADFAELSM